ncbi:SusC/RagA family TonB-linked outer membrane protein [Lewinella sp. IMCC34191]|uniref:SusC/RagA family TonB-linked outer membrane protein n=1 Tax=Lewinella sp. IMCC34191 TaxID=2259172 RepID=UPI000E285717|nr:TonB-dependent receptor [Lewinella sp. IMCC34191]
MRVLYPHLRAGKFRASWHPVSLTVLSLLCSGWLAAQTVTGTVYDETGIGLVGATVMLDGTSTGTVTDFDGNYSLNADEGNVLVFSFTGYVPQTITVGPETVIDVTLEPNVAVLDQIVVTGYNQQRKGDITGAVAVLDADELSSVAASSVNQQLEGRATGIQTSTSGQAGAGTNIRIRGISSFTNNDPLIVVDGVPQLNSYLNNINPQDIASLQILKDASASSIYGTRASNGVIIITTKKGASGKPRITYDAYVGIQDHERGFNDFLIQDPNDYARIFFQQYTDQNRTPPNNLYGNGRTPELPTYIFPARNADGTQPTVDEANYGFPNNIIARANTSGTDWWDAVFDPAPVTDHTLAISGGTDAGTYRISANYFNQQGTMIETYFKRMALRANSQWTLGKFTIGETLNLSRTQNVGVPGGLQSEQGTLMQIIKQQPIIPVYDEGGNFASGKATSLSNGTNPVAMLVRNRNNVGEYDAALGSLFGTVEIIDGLVLKTNFGVNYSVGGAPNFTFPTFENNEPNVNNGFSENLNRALSWVWTNTAKYDRNFNDRHDIGVLVGYEALKERYRQIAGSYGNYFLTDPSVRYLNPGLGSFISNTSTGNEHTLLSIFGSVNYALDNKYLIGATIRRDGSSRFAEENRFGVFPSASLGWRVSAEPFMENIGWLSDLKLRFGFGTVGNENIGNYRFTNQFGGSPASTFYAINGGNTLTTGYTATALGDPSIGWEEKTTSNFGIDLSILEDKVNVVLDIYQSTVDNLLFNPALPNTAGLVTPPFVNIGQMDNNGFDLAINWRPDVGPVKFDIGLNVSQYRNEIVRIDGNADVFSPRGAPGIRTAPSDYIVNQVGSPVGSFFGYQLDGIWQSQAEIDEYNALDGDASSNYMAYAAPGSFRFADNNGFDPETNELTGRPDGVVNDADLTVIGSPHPDFTAGFNLGARVGNFDFTAFLFGSFGNDILNTTKQFTIFREFNTNADRAILTESWTPQNPNGRLPALNINDTQSRVLSSFYVEDGSYVRLKQLQLGYTLPGSVGGNVLKNLRFYVQAQNLFTITDYSGLDPALSSFDVSGNVDADDLYMGIDYGNYPTSRIIMVGVNAGF